MPSAMESPTLFTLQLPSKDRQTFYSPPTIACYAARNAALDNPAYKYSIQ